MQDDNLSSADLVARWRQLRGDLPEIQGVLNVQLEDAPLAAKTTVGRSYTLNAKPGSYVIEGSDAGLGLDRDRSSSPVARELMVGLVLHGRRTDEGEIITAVTPVWRRFLNELADDPAAFYRLDWRQMEELVAGAYREDGWAVTLTPRARDKGRDIIAFRDDLGAIRVLDQVKHYSPGHLVDADDVRAMFDVLSLDPRAFKAVITTTSQFAPGIISEFARVMPTRLDLRDGKQLREWLRKFLRPKSS